MYGFALPSWRAAALALLLSSAHFAICQLLDIPCTRFSTTVIHTKMFDQLKTVIVRPFADKQTSVSTAAPVSPQGKSSEQRFSSLAARSVDESKPDPSSAFERSGWVYI